MRLLQQVSATGTPAENAPQQISLDPSLALDRVDAWVDGFFRLLPNMIVAVVVVALFLGLGYLAQRLVERASDARGRSNLGEVLGGFVKWVVIATGLLFGATIIIPTLKPGDLVAGLGVSSVAIGFAFKDILQNWLAGVLILIKQPFNINDQIAVTGYEGTVERIETRATIIKTYDGQQIVVPNSEIYTNAVVVKTAHPHVRSEYDVGIGYGDGIEHACDVIRTALASLSTVQKNPEPEAFTWDLSASWVTIRARWWTDSRRADVVRVKADVLKAIKLALDDAGIDMPYDTQVQLFHDQTETFDGDRGAQREGWPAPDEGRTQPRWNAQVSDAERTQTAEAG